MNTPAERTQRLEVIVEDLAVLVNAMPQHEQRHALFVLVDLTGRIWHLAWGCPGDHTTS